MALSVDLLKFALLFSTLYAAFGVASPFLPELLSSHGVSPERLGTHVIARHDDSGDLRTARRPNS